METFDPPPLIGECIYCGATERLQDEHVIPYGLNGTWELREASCSSCGDATSKFERNVLRHALLAPRTALGFRSYRKKQRPTSLPLTIDRGQGPETVDLPAAEHPGIAILPRYPLPSWLGGRRRVSGIDVTGADAAHVGSISPEELVRSLGGTQLTLEARYEPAAFARMLAKIAYGYCIGRFGLRLRDANYVVPAILGAADDIGTWVGSTEGYVAEITPVPPGRVTHMVGTDVIGGDIVAYVRLFAWAVPSEYVVVVAPMPPDHQDDYMQDRKVLSSGA